MKKLLLVLFCLFVIMIVVDYTTALVGKNLFGDPSPEEQDSIFLYPPYKVLKPYVLTEIEGPAGTFEVETNRFGLRMDYHPQIDKPEKTLRIGIMGHSTAFGWGLPKEKTFVSLLESQLKEISTNYEVINFAQPEFTSYQALRQYNHLVKPFQCDLLILHFGFYDTQHARLSDENFFNLRESLDLNLDEPGWMHQISQFSNTADWLVRSQQAKQAQALELTMARQTAINNWTERVPENAFRDHLQQIIDDHLNQGGQAILIHGNLLNYQREDAINTLADQFNLPLLNIRSFFDRLGGSEERTIAIDKRLQRAEVVPVSSGESLAYARLHLPEVPPNQFPYLISSNVHIEAATPIPLNDTGQEGDERHRDDIWTTRINVDGQEEVIYSFLLAESIEQLGEDHGSWFRNSINQMVYHRILTPGISHPFKIYTPAHIYQKPLYQHLVFENDPSLPNEMGHLVIAQRLMMLIDSESNQNLTITQVN